MGADDAVAARAAARRGAPPSTQLYDVRRWSTVFPFGMYAACSFVVGKADHATAITSFARIWIWVALAVWGVVFVAMIRRGIDVVAP